ncbi:hypothetical protein NPE51_001016 [Staphylococcus aureus]|nr:hypothetical protein [Staphylococcus aureus]HAR5079224.1 hypothetical protein [Staphylococcus aureus]
MNKINDRDLTELSSYWVYQNIDIKKEFKVNGKRFKQVDSYNDDKNSNLNGAADIKIYELLDDKSKPTGQQTIIYQGTSNEAINPNNPLKSSGFGDDWLQNAKLMNNDNESTDYLKQTDQLSNQYKKKLEDADRLSNSDFLKKYRMESSNFKNKTIVADGGNSEGGAGAKHPNEKVVATDPAMVPYAAWQKFARPRFDNMISFNSTNDLLTWLQDPFIKDMPGKRVNISDGVPRLDALIDSHVGYKRKLNRKDNTYDTVPLIKIKSVKDTEIKNGKKVKKTINITLDMDGRIPINVWTGDSIARSGRGTLIKLNLENLDALSKLITGETSGMLAECVIFLNESFNISENENKNFADRKKQLSEGFKDKINLFQLEEMERTLISKINSLEEVADETIESISAVKHLLPDFALDALKERINELFKGIKSFIEKVYDSIDNEILEIFKNIDHDFKDGVSEEMMKHLKVVKQNIQQIKNQNDIYGRQIADIRSIMKQQDATILDGNYQINYSGENMVQGLALPSNYLGRKMKILKDHIDDGIKKIADYVQGIYDEYASKIVDVIKYLINTIPKIRKNLRHAIEMLNVKKKEFLSLIPNVTCNYIKTKLEELDNTLGKWEPFLNDLKAVSPILDNHLDDIVKNMKPLIVQMIFEPSHYDDMFILNTQAHARLDQMAQQFEVVCNGLNENEGQAIQTMDQSASLIRSNLIQVKEQLEKLAVY